MTKTTRILMVCLLLAMGFLLVWTTPVPAGEELTTVLGRISAITLDGDGRYRVEFNTGDGTVVACGGSTTGLPARLHWAERCPYQALQAVGSEALTIRYLKTVPYEVLTADGQTLIGLNAHRQARTAAVAGAIGLLALAAAVLFSKPASTAK